MILQVDIFVTSNKNGIKYCAGSAKYKNYDYT